jgi:hypothetical protein
LHMRTLPYRVDNLANARSAMPDFIKLFLA